MLLGCSVVSCWSFSAMLPKFNWLIIATIRARTSCEFCNCYRSSPKTLTHTINVDRYIIGLTLGPTFLSASLYLSISTIQRHYPAARFRHLKPHLFATLFILGDFLSLCFIGAGGSLAAIYWWSPIGVNLMIAGLATQVLFTAIFCVLLGTIYRRIR